MKKMKCIALVTALVIMDAFLTGLKTATGLTDAMLWGPTRKVSNSA